MHPTLEAFAAYMDGWPAPVTLADPAQEDCPLIYANARFAALTEYAPTEFLGGDYRFLQGPETDQTVKAAVHRSRAAQMPISVRAQNYTKSGQAFFTLIILEHFWGPDGAPLIIGTQFELSSNLPEDHIELSLDNAGGVSGLLAKLHLIDDVNEQERQAAAVRHSAVVTLLRSYMRGVTFGMASVH